MLSVCNFVGGQTVTYLPYPDEKPYLGVFSEVITPITKEDVNDLNFEVFSSYISRSEYKKQLLGTENENTDGDIIYGCVLKSKLDGIGNKYCPLDLLIALDISGSMSMSVSDNHSRLSLSIKAIKEVYLRLSDNDRIGLLVFDDNASTIFDITFKKDLIEENLYQLLDKIKTAGGTKISSCIKLTKEMYDKLEISNRNRRLLLVTDMNDAGSDKDLINGILKLSEFDKIQTTVVGIGDSIDILLAEKVAKAEGFNYITATNYDEIESNLIKKINMLFYPIAKNIVLSIDSGDVSVTKVYGTNFDNKILELEKNGLLKDNWLSSPIVRFSTSAIIHVFNKYKHKKFSKAILVNIIDYLSGSKTKKIRNVCEIISCTATEKYSDTQAKGKFFVVICKIKDLKLRVEDSIKVFSKFTLTYNSTVTNESFQITKNVRNLIVDKRKHQIDKSMLNGLCMMYYNKFVRDILRNFHKNKKGKNLTSRNFGGLRQLDINGLNFQANETDLNDNRIIEDDHYNPLQSLIDGNISKEVKFENIEDNQDNKNKKIEDPFLNENNLKKCKERLQKIFDIGYFNDKKDFVDTIFKDLDSIIEKSLEENDENDWDNKSNSLILS